MIELHTTNGYRKYININHIVEIAELSENKKANTVIVLATGEKIFVIDYYVEIRKQVDMVKGISKHV